MKTTKEIAEKRFFEWLSQNRMVKEDHALGFLTAVYTRLFGLQEEDLAPSAARRHLAALKQKGVVPDENGYIHAPRQRDRTEGDHCTKAEEIALWFQIFLERQMVPEPYIFTLPVMPSDFEHLVCLAPSGNLVSVCVLDHNEDATFAERNKILRAGYRLAHSVSPYTKDLLPCVRGMKEIYIAEDDYTARQTLELDDLARERGQVFLDDRPILVLDKDSIKGPVIRPRFRLAA